MSGDARRGTPKFPLRLDELGRRAPLAPAVRSAPKPGVKPSPMSSLPAPKLQATAAAARAVLRPQRLVEHAHVDASRRVAPSGIGLDSGEMR